MLLDGLVHMMTGVHRGVGVGVQMVLLAGPHHAVVTLEVGVDGGSDEGPDGHGVRDGEVPRGGLHLRVCFLGRREGDVDYWRTGGLFPACGVELRLQVTEPLVSLGDGCEGGLGGCTDCLSMWRASRSGR